MHKRSLLIGLGIGMIIGALLLQLFNIGSNSQKQLDQLSNEINNTTLDSASPKPETTAPVDVVSDEGAVDTTPSNATELPTNLGTDHEPQQPTTTTPDVVEQVDPESTNNGSETNVEATEPATRYILRIHPGDTVNKTAQLLVDYNIIEDTVSFAAALKERGTQIRAGFFLVEEDSTNEQIRKLLSGTPLTEKNRKNYINVEKIMLIE